MQGRVEMRRRKIVPPYEERERNFAAVQVWGPFIGKECTQIGQITYSVAFIQLGFMTLFCFFLSNYQGLLHCLSNKIL